MLWYVISKFQKSAVSSVQNSIQRVETKYILKHVLLNKIIFASLIEQFDQRKLSDNS